LVVFERQKTNPILLSPHIFWGLKTNLKKQSQFVNGQIGVTSYMKGDYGNKPPFWAQKNKANVMVHSS